ncbi:HNH endonuclease [Vibrio phage K406]
MSRNLVHGVGFNDAKYRTIITQVVNGRSIVVFRCPYYDRWVNILQRCYRKNYETRDATYEDCTVCKERLTFSKFRKWMEQQDWEGKHLDKDLLKVGNTVYCPEYCIFLDRKINNFITDSHSSRGKYKIGVSYHQKGRKFEARCGKLFTKGSFYLGRYDSEMSAHLAWLTKKLELTEQLVKSSLVDSERLKQGLLNYFKVRYKTSYNILAKNANTLED